MKINCHECGACCIILSISTIKKLANVRCVKLLDSGKCSDYDNRPQVCRDYAPDELCYLISTLDKNEQLRVFKSVYGE